MDRAIKLTKLNGEPLEIQYSDVCGYGSNGVEGERIIAFVRLVDNPDSVQIQETREQLVKLLEDAKAS